MPATRVVSFQVGHWSEVGDHWVRWVRWTPNTGPCKHAEQSGNRKVDHWLELCIARGLTTRGQDHDLGMSPSFLYCKKATAKSGAFDNFFKISFLSQKGGASFAVNGCDRPHSLGSAPTKAIGIPVVRLSCYRSGRSCTARVIKGKTASIPELKIWMINGSSMRKLQMFTNPCVNKVIFV